MILDATAKSIEIILGEAHTTSALPVVVAYVDLTTTTTTAGGSDTATNGTTAVTIVSAPAASTQRKINSISVTNDDTVPHDVTVRLNNNTTMRNIVTVTLQVGNTLEFRDTNGWKTLTAGAAILQGDATASEIAYTPTGSIAASTVQGAIDELDTEKVAVSSLGTGIATFLGTPSSANLAAAMTDEVGTGNVLFGSTGTFTPTYVGVTTDVSGVTYDLQVGRYQKVGRLIHILGGVGTDALTVGSGTLRIAGFPVSWAGGGGWVNVIGRAFVGAAGTYNSARPSKALASSTTNYLDLYQDDANTVCEASAAYLNVGANSNRLYFNFWMEF